MTPVTSEISVAALSRRWFWATALVACILTFLQSPGLIAADTKLDLTANPLGFLQRASNQWSSEFTFGQVQNQAYGYFFPHGTFFLLGDQLGLPAWVIQRLWWAALLVAGFWGIIRLAEAIGIGSHSSRIIAALIFTLSPRVLTTLGSISSETAPMMLSPWVLIPVVLALQQPAITGPRAALSPRTLAAQSAIAVALMGAVNAVATAAACLVAVLWWISHRPNKRWWAFTLWWIPSVLCATCWWLVALLMLGKVSPPFLDYIESSAITTQWTSLAEVLRGTDSWTPFVSPERIAGAVLVTQPAAVIATGIIAAAGLAGLTMRSMPAKGRLIFILLVGIAGLTIGYSGELGSPLSEPIRLFLDSEGAPLRNVHKLEPLVRLPLALGVAHLLAQAPLPGSVPKALWKKALTNPERYRIMGVAWIVIVAVFLATSLAWMGKVAPRGVYEKIPDYWTQAAQWLSDNGSQDSANGVHSGRALLVPGAPFASQTWGLTRDEPLQALADTPWAVRDAVPLTPPGAIRALDSVQRLISSGHPSSGLAPTLKEQGISYLVVRNDLDPDTSRSARPLLVHQSVSKSPGLIKVAQFGELIGPKKIDGLVSDTDLRPSYPAIEIYAVRSPLNGPYIAELNSLPIIQGGPESLLRLQERRSAQNLPELGPVLLASDASRAELSIDSVEVTDTPGDRETDFGRVDDNTSALRSAEDPRRTLNKVPDYPVYGAPLVQAKWQGARISVSSSAADATQLGAVSPSSGPAAVIDNDNSTAWMSNGLESAVGQWLQLNFDVPITNGVLNIATSASAIGSSVSQLEISTSTGTRQVAIDKPGEMVSVALPVGATSSVRITSVRTKDGTSGAQFGISEIQVSEFNDAGLSIPVDIRHTVQLPPTPHDSSVRGWDLGQTLSGRTNCALGPDHLYCAKGLGQQPEEPTYFTRTLKVPNETVVNPQLWLRARPSAALNELVAQPERAQAFGSGDISDLRGSARALTDGNRETSWTASEEVVRNKNSTATVTLRLPQPATVSGLDIVPSLGSLPARPTELAVNLGSGPQVRPVTYTEGQPGKVHLKATYTDTITITLTKWETQLDNTALGFVLAQPPGIAEVIAHNDQGPVPGTGVTVNTDEFRTVSLSCDSGPVIAVSGRLIRTSVTATVSQLLKAEPVPATTCDSAEVILPAGEQEISVHPNKLFTVDGLSLNSAIQATNPADRYSVEVSHWSADNRTLQVLPGSTDRVVVIPESYNLGWLAHSEEGTQLQPLVVNGWQQGWIVPAGVSGIITLTFPSNKAYRMGIFGGLSLFIPLIISAIFRRRCDPQNFGNSTRTWQPKKLAVLGIFSLAFIVAGIVGLATAGILTSIVSIMHWRISSDSRKIQPMQILVVISGAMMVLATAILSKGPWRSPTGYLGDSFWVQLPALIAVLAVAISTVPRFKLDRFASQD
ncbi:MAG: DUF3367 domain-containing protein [Mycobacteriaceae bacterium]